MKKITAVLAIILCITLALCGCDALLPAASPEEVYSKLDSLVSNPDGSTDLNGSVTFVAYIASEPFEETFTGEEKVYTYQVAYISRNDRKPIYLDITDIDTVLPADSYASITGTVTGNVYWTADNKQEKVLDFHATNMEAFSVPETEPSTVNKLDLADSPYSGTFEFVGAHYSKNSFNDVIVLYFNFTNTAPESNVKISGISILLDRMYISVGEQYITNASSAFKPEELDPGALDAHSSQAYTPSGKTQLYYMAIEVNDETPADAPIYIDVYSDEFALTNSIEIPVSTNLSEMNQ